jgi:alkanesulfonate monooxygenase SsuD/methylene tetrahydromethanopterin reductase-like flavin-dependent oxidoreductase (luciferase family)
MKFGIFDHIERRDDVELAQQYEERLQLMEQADEAGIYSYHIAQHHHSPLCLAPNQSVLLAAAAQRTKRMRFGPLVYILPLHNPIRLIEEVCMVDQLSSGRLDMGVGPGTGGGTELAMWGENPDNNFQRFEETLGILRTGLQSEFLTYHGEVFNVQDLWMELRPKQTPHPPLWWAGSPESAAKHAANFIANGPINMIARLSATYLEAWEKERPNDAANVYRHDNPLHGGTRRILICDSEEEARERGIAAYESYLSHFAKPAPDNGDAPEGAAGAFNEVVRQSDWFKQQQLPREPEPDANRVRTMNVTPEQAIDVEALLVGTADSVRQYVERYVEESGANYFVGSFQWGDLTHEEATKSLRLFSDHVMPDFVDVPVTA